MDLFLRGRGAEVGVRAPGWLVRACGAALGLGIAFLCTALGVDNITGAPAWVVHVSALVGGALLAPSAMGSVLWLFSGLLACTLMLVMYTPLVVSLVPTFVRADAAASAPVDAVVVLSGGLTADGRITGQAIDRLLSAVQTAKMRGIGELAVSIVDLNDAARVITSEQDQRALLQLMAPELSISAVRDVHSTRDEALAFAALARTRRWRRVVLVTSPMHTRRSCAAFEQAGLAVECRPADGRDYSVRTIKSGENRRLAFQDVLYEVAATLLYRARGWMR